jgi:hypothetical protein
MWTQTLTTAKRLVRIVVGFTLLAAGAAMLVLPGPGIVTIIVALVTLSAEFVWARRLLQRIKNLAPSSNPASSRPGPLDPASEK